MHKLAREASEDITEFGGEEGEDYNTQQAVKDLFDIAKQGLCFES